MSGTPSYTVGLSSSGVTPGTYGSGSLIPVITVDTYGRLTSVTNISPVTTFTEQSLRASLYCAAFLSGAPNYPQVNCAVANTYYEIANATENSGGASRPWVTDYNTISNFAMTPDGRFTYTGLTSKTFYVTFYICIRLNTIFSVAVRKNGVDVPGNFAFSGNASGTTANITGCPMTLSTNDYISAWVNLPLSASQAIMSSAIINIRAVG